MNRKGIPVVAWLLVTGCNGPTAATESGTEIPLPAAGSGSPFVVPTAPVVKASSAPQLASDQSPIAAPACAPAKLGYADADVVEMATKDAATLDAEAASQTFYISLSHLAEGRDECDLDFFRYGIGQLTNMMSWANDIVATEFIDANKYIARVDVRALNWTPDALPYMLSAAKRGDYGIVSAPVGKPAVVRGDWLAQQMTRAPVYGYIMRNELFERQMEEQAKVDNSKPGKLGGVYESIVAQNPRILERRDSEYGACWISHDFLYRTQATVALETGE
ncbi:MAG TPA: hypothetical protein VMF89_24895, partial [Polyangiales bacterium]|nr:hypothetical protein [Polyangiales bacterium]